MKIHTIGFTQKGAKDFFGMIKQQDIHTLIDVRLNNTSQLSAFTKKNDLKYFLKELCNCEYVHIPDLAPTKEILKPYQKKEISLEAYEDKFMNLMQRRRVERYLRSEDFNNSCLLCSEHLPHYCHRRLVLEYLKKFNHDIQSNHLVNLL